MPIGYSLGNISSARMLDKNDKDKEWKKKEKKKERDRKRDLLVGVYCIGGWVEGGRLSVCLLSTLYRAPGESSYASFMRQPIQGVQPTSTRTFHILRKLESISLLFSFSLGVVTIFKRYIYICWSCLYLQSYTMKIDTNINKIVSRLVARFQFQHFTHKKIK